jgi:hypothetical protein
MTNYCEFLRTISTARMRRDFFFRFQSVARLGPPQNIQQLFARLIFIRCDYFLLFSNFSYELQ